jgi:uncharacterized SAM-binding protein YcdF (DUF218 family)
MTMFRLIRAALLVLGFGAALWLLGLALFVEHIRSLDAATLDADPAPADAIVALTGGSERLHTGLELLNEGKGKKLFISGVHPGLSLEKILGGQTVAANLRDCCIVLGHTAESTEGNAEETQNWLAIEGYTSLRLVTANYHMPRSLLLFHALMPEMKIIPHPIAPESVLLDAWWRHSGTAALLINEYDKYLFARLGLWIGVL